MSIPPALTIAAVPAIVITTWLYLHKDADVEQRANITRAEMRVEKAQFDRDFARARGVQIDPDLEKLEHRIKEAEVSLAAAEQKAKDNETGDQRGFVKNELDNLFKPEPKEVQK